MKESFAELAANQLKKFIPFFVTLFLVLIDFVPTHLPLSHFLRPDLALICVYFWLLYRLDLFGVVSTLLLGLVVDSLSGVPLGTNICVFMLVYLLTMMISSYVNTKPFMISWLVFALIALAAFLFKWILFCVYYRVFLTLPNILTTYLVTVLIYPLIARLNMALQNRYLKTSEDIDE